MKLPNIPGKKQLLGILLSLGIIAAMVVPATEVSANNSIATVSLSPAIINLSSTTPSVTVSVMLSTDYAIHDWGLNIKFDATKLQVESASITFNNIWAPAAHSPQAIAIIDNTTGRIVGLSDAPQGSQTKTGNNLTLATMIFDIVPGTKNVPASAISFESDVKFQQDENGLAVGPPYVYGSGSGDSYLILDTSSTNIATTSGTTWVPATVNFPNDPTISSISNNNGTSGNAGKTGDTMTISGQYLTGATAVAFGTYTGTNVSVASDTSLTVRVPNMGTNNISSVPVTVTTPTGTSTSLPFSYFATPGAISLNQAYYKAGDTATITGSNFTHDTNTTLTINGVSATYSYVSATSLTAVIPALGSSNIATVPVVVTTPGGSGNAHFDFVAAPTYVSTTGSGLMGSTLTITGTNFYSTTGALATVTFGSTAGTNVAVVNSTTITVTIPNLGNSNITAEPFTVTTYGGTCPGTFNYSALGVTSFTPSSARAGATVTINVTGFTQSSVTAVEFGPSPFYTAPSFSVNSAGTVITATVPDMGVANSNPITVVAGTTSVASTGSFSYIPSVEIGVAQQTTGSTFKVLVNINANGASPVRAWQANISFDATQVSCTGVSVPLDTNNNPADFLGAYAYAHSGETNLGRADGGLQSIINNSNGTITALGNAILGAGTNGPTGQGILAILTFSVNSPSTINSLPQTWVKLTNVIVDDNNINAITNVIVVNSSSIQLPTGNQVNYPGALQSDTVDATLGDQLTLISPASIAGWNLVVSANNNVQRTLNVFSNTNWSLTVSATNGGHLTQFDGNTNTYNNVQLSNPLSLLCDAGNGGTGAMVNLSGVQTVLATGTNLGQNIANGGDLRNCLFNQAVTYTDPTTVSTGASSYHIVVTFIATNTSW